MAKSTVYRLIRTLSECNLVSQNKENQKYQLGIAAFELGFRVYHSMELRRISLPIVEKLSLTLRKVVRLGIYDNGSVIYLCKREYEKNNGTISKIGERSPTYCTSIGKILLAHQSEQEIIRTLQGELIPYTSKTVTAPHLIKKQLLESQQRGYAIEMDEIRNGLSSVAVPVYNDFGKTIAALSVTGPTHLFKANQVQQYVTELRTSSNLITEQIDIGYYG